MNTSTNNSAVLAANFQVTELEPRLENGWASGYDEPKDEHPCPAAGC